MKQLLLTIIPVYLFFNTPSFSQNSNEIRELEAKYQQAKTGSNEERVNAILKYAEALLLETKTKYEEEKLDTLFQRAVEVAQSTSNKELQAQAFYSAGRYYSRLLSSNKKAIEYLSKSAELYQAVGNLKGEINAVYASGWQLIRMNDYENAIFLLEDALKMAQKAHQYDIVFNAAKDLSLVYNMNGDESNADRYQKIAYDIASVSERLSEKEKELQEKDQLLFVMVPVSAFLLIIGGLLVIGNRKISSQNKALEKEKKNSEKLLLNILPKETANELLKTGKASPKLYESVSVMFTDFKDFTGIAEHMTPEELIEALDDCFQVFDRITEKYGIERIKTIGDAYMCVCGAPSPSAHHAANMVKAAIEIRDFMMDWNQLRIGAGKEPFLPRLGIHSGKIVAGVVGKKKFAFDIWGDTVNLASRMESSCETGKINISEASYQLVSNLVKTTYRGEIAVKNRGEVEMYYVESLA